MIRKLFDRLRAWLKERSYLRTVASAYGIPVHWHERNNTRARRISAALTAAGNNVRRMRLPGASN